MRLAYLNTKAVKAVFAGQHIQLEREALVMADKRVGEFLQAVCNAHKGKFRVSATEVQLAKL
jgi:acyl-CoA synthetase (AMP-forming)/AMP-acid ligase II